METSSRFRFDVRSSSELKRSEKKYVKVGRRKALILHRRTRSLRKQHEFQRIYVRGLKPAFDDEVNVRRSQGERVSLVVVVVSLCGVKIALREIL